MTTYASIEPAVDPNNRISFLLDWELTLKCNLDCSYCSTGMYGGHDNSTKHPDLVGCLQAIDFMFAYVDLYMKCRPRGLKYVILNVYGGESLHHPRITDILQQIRQKYQVYQDSWHLVVTTTTNAIMTGKKLQQVLPYIDEFTVSYHTENTNKQKMQFKENLLAIRDAGKRQKCVVLMHNQADFFDDAQEMIAWLQQHDIRMLPRQLDGPEKKAKTRIYNQQQVKWFDKLYNQKTFAASNNLLDVEQDASLTDVGRACCGGRQTCVDQNYKQRHFYIQNTFQDWYCSVNHFFLYVKQVNGEIFVNKDCKMNFSGGVGPIGNLNNAETILQDLKTQLSEHTLPIIQCKKQRCYCGLCAPKAKSLPVYKQIMNKYQT